VRVERDPATDDAVRRAETLIAQIRDQYVSEYDAFANGGPLPRTVYGVTTGFGEFKDKAIHPDELVLLQRNLLLSHSVGVGGNSDPSDRSNYFPAEVVRGALLTRLNAFLKGNSGVRLRLVEIVQAMLNRGIVPLVPLGDPSARAAISVRCPISSSRSSAMARSSWHRRRPSFVPRASWPRCCGARCPI